MCLLRLGILPLSRFWVGFVVLRLKRTFLNPGVDVSMLTRRVGGGIGVRAHSLAGFLSSLEVIMRKWEKALVDASCEYVKFELEVNNQKIN